MTTINFSPRRWQYYKGSTVRDAKENELVYLQPVLRSHCHDKLLNNRDFKIQSKNGEADVRKRIKFGISFLSQHHHHQNLQMRLRKPSEHFCCSGTSP